MGAVHRPFGQWLIGDRGLGLAAGPSYAYYVMLAISSIGLNVAISRLVAERLALSDLRGARRVYKVASAMLIVSGVAFALLFGLGAKWLARLVEMPEAWPGFLALAPAVLFVSLLCGYRGLYQGMQQMQPSAVSQVVEQIVRVGLSIPLMAVLARISLPLGAAGFNAGNTVGTFSAVLYFAWLTYRTKATDGWTTVAPGVQSWEHESVTTLMGKILAIALPLSLIGAAQPLMGFLDTKIVTNRLTMLGMSGQVHDAVAWLGNASTFRDLPTILTNALYVSLVPAIAESFATGRLDQARYRASTAFRITFLIAVPATVGLAVGAQDVYGILLTGPGWIVMEPLAWSAFFLMIQYVSSGTLQGMGRIMVSVRNLVAGLLVKVALTYWWTGLPALGVRGAAYATSVGIGVTAGLNLWALWRHLGLKVDLKGDVLRPALASAVMGLSIWLASPVVHHFIHFNRLAALIVVGFAGAIYAVAIFVLGGVTKADLGLIPGVSAGMLDKLSRYRLLRN
jgi:stage V sporulation protein B